MTQLCCECESRFNAGVEFQVPRSFESSRVNVTIIVTLFSLDDS